jgi:hypothetical protein
MADPTSKLEPGEGRRPHRRSSSALKHSETPNRPSSGPQIFPATVNEQVRPAAETPVEFAALPDGSLIELIESPTDVNETMLAYWRDGDTTYHKRVTVGDKCFVPLPNKKFLLRHIVLPNRAMPYENALTLALRVAQFIHKCVALEPGIDFLLMLFVLSTWITDRLPIAPYLSISGLPQSGKTTLLQVLRLICRRGLLTGDISSAGFYHACDLLQPTLLIDEAGTSGNDAAIRLLLRMGNARDSAVTRKDQIYSVYGPKVIAWLEPPNDAALSSRCVSIQMSESKKGLQRVTAPEIVAEAAELRAQLLRYRFAMFNKVKIQNFSGEEMLPPRRRDLFHCLAATVENMEGCEILLSHFKLNSIYSREPLRAQEDAVLTALFLRIHKKGFQELVMIKDLASGVNNIVELAGAKWRVTPRKVGAVLATFGITDKRRRSDGWMVLLTRADQERIHQLVERHGLDAMKKYTNVGPRDCPLCNPLA